MTSRLRNAARVAATEYVNMPRQRVPGHTPTPPPPLIGPSGSPRVDAVSDVVNRAVEPFRTAPNPKEGVCGAITHYVGGALGILGVPFEMMDTGFAMLTAPIAALFPGLPAATLMAPHLGPPHTHTHPPSLVPPAPPVPLPSIGMVMLPGCVSVFHGGIPAARAGDLGMSFTCGTLAPPLDVYTGSSNTFIGGSRAARMTDITRHCNPASASMFGKIMQGVGVAMGAIGAGAKATAGDALGATMAAAQAAADAAAMAMVALLGKDPGLPPGYGVLMMGNPMVLIGGFPMPDLMEVLGALFKAITKGVKRLRAAQRNSKRWRNFSNRMHQRLNPLLHRLGMSRNNRRRMHRALCFLTGHPVDVATGNVLTDAVDLELPGPLPLKISRDYYSCDLQTGPFGNNWSFAYDLALLADPKGEGVVVRMADGRPLLFPPCAKGQTRFDRRERATLIHDEEGYSVRFADGLRHLFGPATPGAIQPLVQLRDRAGHKIRFFYDERGDLERIVDSSKRTLEIERDDQGRIVEIAGPTPEGDGRMAFARYFYDRHGDLVEVHDALGQAQRYVYNNHLLVQETDRNGLSFYFEYDGDGAHARCLRTWGDGGIYDHKLEYDAEAMTTKVTDSLGAVTTYHLGGDGMVHQIEDALGGVRSFNYNEWGQPITEIDELGGVTYHEYDDRGNRSKLVHPDGASLQLGYDDGDLVARMIDENGAWWQWEHDERGLVIRGLGPGQSRRYAYTGRYLVGVFDGDGHGAQYGYDALGNLEGVLTTDGAMHRWIRDALGRVTLEIDATGAKLERRYDGLGRVVEAKLPDGEVHRFEYDGLGRMTRALNPREELRLRWGGMGRLLGREQGDTAVRFEYDKEERLRAVVDDEGRRYAFELDAKGSVEAELRFDGSRWVYERDPCGRVVKLIKPSGREIEYEYDSVGRVAKVIDEDGEREFRYRSDGLLVGAKNSVGEVIFDRDAAGRITRERWGEDWISSSFDERGLRTQARSSRGAQIDARYDDDGDLVGLAYESADGQARWRTSIERDPVGSELSRELPGGLRSVWSYTGAGQPQRHRLEGASFELEQSYTWAVGDRLERLRDQGGATVFGYDALGRLAWAQPETGAPEIRVSDVQGNRYRRRDRADRRYGANGELSVASTKRGTETYRYDEDGQLVEKTDATGQWRYHWNAGGELVAVERPDKQRVEFEYDALGRRVSKRAAGVVRRWLWDGDQLLHEWVEGQEDGAVTWLFDPNEYNLTAKIVDGRCSTVIGDHLGAPQLMLGPEGEREWSASLSIHGELRELEGERGALPFRWPGQYEDEETGLYYNRFRYYDPGTGCFVSPDPLRVVGGLALGPYVRQGRFAPDNGLAELGPTTSLYAYVDDPLSWIDPYGLVEIHREGAYKVHAYAGPAVGGKEHAPLHVHVYEGREGGQGTRVLMEDWVDGGRLKGRRGEVYPGDGSLPRRARKMISSNLDDLSAKARRVFETGSC